jgi:hypothetical protein
MSTMKPLPGLAAATWPSAQAAVAALAKSRPEPPDRLPITAGVLRAIRKHGWTIAEQQSAGWQYLILRGHAQSAVYKLVGPLFDGTGSRYQGYRIA